jgi:parallel beta-helix repeat protein
MRWTDTKRFLLLLLFNVVAGDTVVHVKDGRLPDGQYVGVHTSEIAANVIEKLFRPVSHDNWQDVSMFNSSVLRYLLLEGDYLADIPLRLPSLFVLHLKDGTTIKPAANLSLENTTSFTGLVEMKDVHFSAVLGGLIDASSLPAAAFLYPYRRGYQAVSIMGGGNNAVRHVKARANNSDAAVGVNQSPAAEISHCDIGGGANGQGVTKGRCIWCLATSRALVHDNWVRNCSSHSLDFDAYTSASAAYNNLCEDGTEEGIFVEETAKNNFIFNNTLRRNGCGIGVYANAAGPVTGNMIIGNTMEDNRGNAITAGGYGHDPSRISSGNVFASNTARNNVGHNGGQLNVHHGATVGDKWTDNHVFGAAPAYAPSVPNNSTEVIIFEPERV